MTIYEIDARIAEILMATDEETGEIPASAFDELEQLAEDREMKIENAACLYIDLKADAKAISEQEGVLAQRRRSLTNRAERIKNYIEYAINGEDFSSPRVQVKHRFTKEVQIDDNAFWMHPDERFVRQRSPEADKVAIRAALNAGEDVPGATIVGKWSMSIK